MNFHLFNSLPSGFLLALILFSNTICAQTNNTPMTVFMYEHQSVTCHGGNDGIVEAMITGGQPPYNFQWSNNNQTLLNSNLSAGTYTITVSDAAFNTITKANTITLQQPVQMYIDITSNPVSTIGAMDGEAEVISIVGGIAPYSYIWSPQGGNNQLASNLSEGVYEVLVTDAIGCTASKSVVVEPPAGMEIVVVNTNEPTCGNSNDGSITVTTINGEGPYYYWWSPYGGTKATATNLIAGAFTVYSMDQKGTYIQKVITLNGPNELLSDVVTTDVTCNGANNGTATVNVSGGTPPFNYSWYPANVNLPTILGLPTGFYSCMVTDANGCTASSNHELIQQAYMPFSLDVNVLSNASCTNSNAGSAEAEILGGQGPYSFHWMPSGLTTEIATSLNGGSHTVTVTDAYGCDLTETFIVGGPASMLTLNNISVDNVTCNGSHDGSISLSVSGGTSPYIYTTTNSTSLPVNGLSNLPPGNYNVTVTDANGCSISQSASITYSDYLDEQITTSNAGIICFGETANLVLSGIVGNTYNWKKNNNYTGEVGNSFAATKSGTYMVEVTTPDGCVYHTNKIKIKRYGLPVADITPSTATEFCYNEDIEFSVTPTIGATYQWHRWSSTLAGETGSSLTTSKGGKYYVVVTDSLGCTQVSKKVKLKRFRPFTVSISTNDSTDICPGQSALINSTVIGGTQPYTYQWYRYNSLLHGATTNKYLATTIGGYKLVVTDSNGCEYASKGRLVFSDAGCSLSISRISSNNSDIKEVSNGSIKGLENLMENDKAKLKEIHEGSLSLLPINSIPENQLEKISSIDNLKFCSGESAFLKITGVKGNSYHWKKNNEYINETTANLKVNSTGLYSVEVTTANGQMYVTNKLEVTVIPNPDATLDISGVVEFCANKPVTLNALKNDDYSYFWYRNSRITDTESGSSYSANKSGTYKVVIKDKNGCISASKSVSLNKIAAFRVDLNPVGYTDICQGDSVILQSSISGGTAPYIYEWYNKNEPLKGNAKDQLITKSGGSYSVQITDSKGCMFTNSRNIEVYSITCKLPDEPIQQEKEKLEVNSDLEIAIYPNPFRDAINVNIPSYSNEDLEIRITDLFGRRIFRNIYPGAYKYEISLIGVENGYYILEVIQGSRSGRVKMLKQD